MSLLLLLGGSGPGAQTVSLPLISAGQVFAPNAFEPRTVGIAFLGDTGRVLGPRFNLFDEDGNPVVVARLAARLFPADYSGSGVELDDSWGRRWQDVLKDAGEGRVNVQNDDPDAAGLDFGKIIRFDLDGEATWSMSIEGLKRRTLQVDEADEYTSVTGGGLLAEWERSVVDPPLGPNRLPFADQRIMSYVDPSYDDVSWGTAVATTTNVGQIGVAPADLQPPAPPAGFPTQAALQIWDRSSAGPSVPQGFAYFRKAFTVGSDLTVQVWAGGDDAYDIHLDGVPILSDPGWYRGQHRHQQLELTAGTHYIAASVENQNAAKAGLWLAVVEVDTTTGKLEDVPVLVTDATWKVLGYPSEIPGFTPGACVHQFFDEAQAQGQLSEWTIVGDRYVDAQGNPWQTIVRDAFNIGLDLVSALKQLGETHIDFEVAPARRELRIYNLGALGQSTPVVLDADVNLDELVHDAQAPVANELLVRWAGGYLTVTDAASVATHGRIRAPLRLEGIAYRDVAERIATERLPALAHPRVATVAGVVPVAADDQPYTAYRVGDYLTADDETGAGRLQRVRSITVEEDENGELEFAPELRDVVLERDDLVAATIKRAANGTVGGQVQSASFVSCEAAPPLVEDLEQPPPFSFPGTIRLKESGEYEFQSLTRIFGVVLKSVGVGTGTTTLRWKHNGTVFATSLSLVAGAVRNVDLGLDRYFERGDRLRVEATAAGGHTEVTVQFLPTR